MPREDLPPTPGHLAPEQVSMSYEKFESIMMEKQIYRSALYEILYGTTKARTHEEIATEAMRQGDEVHR